MTKRHRKNGKTKEDGDKNSDNYLMYHKIDKKFS